MKGLLVGLALLFAVPCWAGEKEELELKKQVLLERIGKNQAYIQLLNMQNEQATKEAADIAAKLKKFETPKKDEKK